ncbi:MAG TPA: glucose-6-phosphate isomerase [Stellaceae bacterium]|nr:glucose-6-phosphate isomerase [Stellaceae bacterium]
MLYRHDVTGCNLDAIGALGLGAGELAALLERARPALEKLRAARAKGAEPLLAIADRRDDLAALQPLAAEFRKFEHVIVLGTGGSSLGGQTLYSLVDRGFGPPKGTPRLHFMDNIDPATFEALQQGLDLSRTGVIAISKSGGTAETLTQFLILLEALRKATGRRAVGERCLVLTEPTDTPLSRLARAEKIRTLGHDPAIGGRFSVLSNVGMLPALIAGIDAEAVRRGAAQTLSEALAATSPRNAAPAMGAAIGVGLAELRNIRTTVLMPYADRLATFGLWYRQLWAESLGKDGRGTTPIRALGTVDQHSQLQLYLDGPGDKLFTLLMLDQAGHGERVASGDSALAYLNGRSMGDLLEAEQRATAETLVLRGRPTRVIRLDRLDPERLGALFMHFILETLIAADLLGVSAFGQPAVEQGKVLARRYLGELGKEGAQSRP